MKILQMADFHFGSQQLLDGDAIENRVNKLYSAIKDELPPGEPFVICLCGDIIENEKTEGYVLATDFLKCLQEKFVAHAPVCLACPGNHDSINSDFGQFNQFCNNNGIECSSSKTPTLITIGEVDFLLMNTAASDFKYGSFVFNDVQQALQSSKNKTKIIVMHHSLMSDHKDDASSLRGAYELTELCESFNVTAVLHGHTHCVKHYVVGKQQCRVVGVGPFFKDIQNINHQFNIISLLSDKIICIKNYRYNRDEGTTTGERGIYKGTEVFKNQSNAYVGEKFSALYKDIVAVTQSQPIIHNLSINVRSSKKVFLDDIETHFKESIPDAEKWQSSDCPPDIYFNHGAYFEAERSSGIQYVIDELQRKSSSGRAVIPLYNFENVVSSGDGFLPSLMLMQFGIDREQKTLLITIYLRALELSEFLKINICEIYLCAIKVLQSIARISDVDITIYAFRAQAFPGFSCFKKAKIDALSATKISLLVYRKKIAEIIELLEEKREHGETVLSTSGIDNLKSALETIIEEEKTQGFQYYSDVILVYVEKLRLAIQELIAVRERHSEVADIDSFLGKYKTALNNLIVALRTIMQEGGEDGHDNAT